MKKRIVAFFLALSMMFVLLPAGVSAKTLEEALQEKKELAEQIAQKQKELAAIQDEVEKAEAIRNEYSSQLNDIRELIRMTKEAIELLNEQIGTKEEELAVKQQELDESYELLGQRLRYLHMNNNSSTLSVMLGASSFSEAMIIGEYMAKISAHDTQLIDTVTEIRDQIQEIKDDLEKDRIQNEMLLEEQAAHETEAARLLMQANENLSYVEALEQVLESEEAQLLEQYEAAQREINSLMSNWNDVPYVGGDFRWPVPNYPNISSGYGWRTLYGQPNFHTGIDIAGSGINGKGVIASNQGIVYKTVYGYTGYGHYIIVDHGGGWMTLYAHLSQIYVTEGETVNQGATIGAVGSTGNSTGPHLHFEIRQKGEKLDPIGSGLLLRY